MLKAMLREPLTARRILEGLRSAGHRVLIEESRPEANRLRLRFSEATASD